MYKKTKRDKIYGKSANSNNIIKIILTKQIQNKYFKIASNKTL